VNPSRFRLFARTPACLAVLLASTGMALAAPPPRPGGAFTKGLPNLNSAQCRSDNAPGTDPKCSSEIIFEVVVNPLIRNGSFVGCAAFFFYRDLTIMTKRIGGGEATTVHWQITYAGPAPGARAQFVAPGIRINSKPGNGQPPPGDLFQAPVIAAGASAVSVGIKKQALRKFYDHLPVVQYMDNSVGWTDCGGVDPTISNNPS
jgi:hypothetical protein